MVRGPSRNKVLIFWASYLCLSVVGGAKNTLSVIVFHQVALLHTDHSINIHVFTYNVSNRGVRDRSASKSKYTKSALSKTCRDANAGTTPGQYNRQRCRDSRDAVLSETFVQRAITTIQAGTTLPRRWSRDNRQPSVQHQILFRTIWRRANSRGLYKG